MLHIVNGEPVLHSFRAKPACRAISVRLWYSPIIDAGHTPV
jgi:hypothetical protein